MPSETSSIPQSDDTEAKMRRSLGLDQHPIQPRSPSSPNDPLRGARQAIRSQAIAREYVERQLAHAEATIQDLRTKLHHARQEKDTAVEACSVGNRHETQRSTCPDNDRGGAGDGEGSQRSWRPGASRSSGDDQPSSSEIGCCRPGSRNGKGRVGCRASGSTESRGCFAGGENRTADRCTCQP